MYTETVDKICIHKQKRQNMYTQTEEIKYVYTKKGQNV